MISETFYQLTAFLGPIGGPEMIMILVVLVLLAIPVVVVIALLIFFKSRNKSPNPIAPPASVQSRLAELDALRSQNMISEVEYDEKRKQIINGI